MALKYCAGSPRQAEAMVGWSRQAVELGLHEKRTGIVCLSDTVAWGLIQVDAWLSSRERAQEGGSA